MICDPGPPLFLRLLINDELDFIRSVLRKPAVHEFSWSFLHFREALEVGLPLHRDSSALVKAAIGIPSQGNAGHWNIHKRIVAGDDPFWVCVSIGEKRERQEKNFHHEMIFSVIAEKESGNLRGAFGELPGGTLIRVGYCVGSDEGVGSPQDLRVMESPEGGIKVTKEDSAAAWGENWNWSSRLPSILICGGRGWR